jgi:outer membrane protein OmpA-like peptidoglycan-associated protein
MNEASMCAALTGYLVGAFFLSAPALAQQSQPDDPVPPDAIRKIENIQRVIEKINRATANTDNAGSGAPERVTGQAESVQSALKALGATVTGKEIKINLSADVLFDFDKSTLRPEAGPALEKVATVLKQTPSANTLIEGHTDGKGTDPYNQALSERRAESVRGWFIVHGIRYSAISALGWGKTRPIAPNSKPNGSDDPDGRQKNRRVEITVKTE